MTSAGSTDSLVGANVPEPVTLRAADGFPVAATRFMPQGRPRGGIVVAGATGVPQTFYRRFAEHACGRGFAVLTFDYRGLGKSKPADLRGFKADLLDWAQLDLAAAVEAMTEDQPLFVVGHSFGGQALGLLPNHHRVAKLYTFGTGAGWHGWMPFPENLRIRFMWAVVLPVLAAWKGYSPWAMLRLGEDLPLGVYRQWKAWCALPHYFFDDPNMAGVGERFAQVRIPIVAANALDDRWALPRSRDAFMQGYRNAPVVNVDIDPRKGLGSIGHMGYFRQKAQPLWDDVLQWFMQP